MAAAARAPSFFVRAFKGFGSPLQEEGPDAMPLMAASTCTNSEEATAMVETAAAETAGCASAWGHHGQDRGPGDVMRRLVALVLSKRWLDVDILAGRNPHVLLALLVVLGFGVYLLQCVFIKSFLRPVRPGSRRPSSASGTLIGSVVPEAEEMRVAEKCVRIFLHRCFLVACIVASVGHPPGQMHYAFFREWTFYLFSAAASFLLRRTLLLSETALEHVTAVVVPGGGQGLRGSHAVRPSIGTVLLWLGANLGMVMAFIYRQLAAFPPQGLVSTLYPLAIYDAAQLLVEAGQVWLKYAALLREEEEEEQEEEEEDVDADEQDATAKEGCCSSGSSPRSQRPTSAWQRVRAWLADWGRDDTTAQQHTSFYLGFSGACVALVQHLHVWFLKGFGSEHGGGGLSDFLFFFLLQRCLWRLLHVSRSFLISLSIERLISRCFPLATEAELTGRDAAADVCSICLKRFHPHTNVKRLPCNHLLHASCLLQCLAHGTSAGSGVGGGGGQVGMGDAAGAGPGGIWYASTAKCPLCRRDLLCTGREGQRWVGPVSARDAMAPSNVETAAAAGPVRPVADGGEQQEERLLRLSTADLLPPWLPLPVPSLSLEVVRRRPGRGRGGERVVGGQEEERGADGEDEPVQISPQ